MADPIYQVNKWTTTFENAESRRLVSLRWVPVPIGFDSNGFALMVERFGELAPAIYGAWIALVQVAGGCPVRGVLCTSKGKGLTSGRLGFITRFPASLFDDLIAWASSDEVGWLQILTPDQIDQLFGQLDSDSSVQLVSQGPRQPDSDSGEQSGFASLSPGKNLHPADAQRSLGTKGTEQNGRERNHIEPNGTEPQVGVGLGWLEERFQSMEIDLDQLEDRVKRFRKRAGGISRSRLDGSTIGAMILISQATTPELEHDLAARFLEGKIRKPTQYLAKAVGNTVEPLGINAAGALKAATDRIAGLRKFEPAEN